MSVMNVRLVLAICHADLIRVSIWLG
jgi:hypothetical protein